MKYEEEKVSALDSDLSFAPKRSLKNIFPINLNENNGCSKLENIKEKFNDDIDEDIEENQE